MNDSSYPPWLPWAVIVVFLLAMAWFAAHPSGPAHPNTDPTCDRTYPALDDC